jgi:hypothetical protein
MTLTGSYKIYAIRRARAVFPFPGGPYSKNPFGGFTPNFSIDEADSKLRRLKNYLSIDFRISSWPPTCFFISWRK